VSVDQLKAWSWRALLVLLAFQAAYLSFLVVMTDSVIFFDARPTLGNIDWAGASTRFNAFDHFLGNGEVMAYWIALGLAAARRRLFLPFYAFAAVVRFHYWLRFIGVPEFPSWPGYVVTVNEFIIIGLVYYLWTRKYFR